jgi:tRNA (mo5U34)-methyltransferase
VTRILAQVNAQELKAKVDAIQWWHSIDLGDGIRTPGMNDTPRRLPLIGLPDDLSGVTVIDIGAWDGFYSFEAERRGATRVLATDSFCWGGGGWGTKAGFDLAHAVLGSKVESKNIDVLELSPEIVGTFDLVLFLGVLYHMRHPLLALERVFSVTARQAIIETHVELMTEGRPAMVFYPGGELLGDQTNWWGPNPAAVEAMLKSVGFLEVKLFAQELGDTAGRMVFHAWRCSGP